MFAVKTWLKETAQQSWSVESYGAARTILGLYLAVHFAMLIPWGAELFSSAGVMGDPGVSPLSFFPNIFAVGDPAVATSVLVAATLASLALAVGWNDRWVALGLWYVWAAALTRNPLIANPGIPFVGWMLLMHALLPRDEEGRAVMTGPFWLAAWVLVGAGYSYGGLSKLESISWLDGTALYWVWESPLARDTALRAWLVELPMPLIKSMTWGTLLLELVALPLALSRRLRPFLWCALTAMHVGILATVAFADLTIGMLMIHVIAFDPGWFARLRFGRRLGSRSRRAQARVAPTTTSP